MSTTIIETHSQPEISLKNKIRTTLYVSHWAVVLGRTLFSSIFILAAASHFKAETIYLAASQGVPFANVLVPLAGILSFLGGASILFGFHQKMGALMLIAFLIPVTFSMHAFWTEEDPMMMQMQMANFLKNVSLFGGAVLMYQFATDPVRATRRTISRYPRRFKPSIIGGPGYTE
jgi:putative oxidoreductase